MTLPLNMVTNVLSENQNKFITVNFLTKDNEERTYTGRMNVIKGLKGNERGRIFCARDAKIDRQNCKLTWFGGLA